MTNVLEKKNPPINALCLYGGLLRKKNPRIFITSVKEDNEYKA